MLTVIDLSTVPNLEYKDDLVRLNRIDDTVIADAEAPGSFETVAKGFSEFYWMRGQL